MTPRSEQISLLNRRTFFRAAAASAIVAGPLPNVAESIADKSPALLTGNGAWTYQMNTDWGTLPAGLHFGGTHGAIATDMAGNIYVSTQSDTGVLVYSQHGQLLRQIAREFPEIHSMVHAVEGGNEFFYSTVQKGTANENWLFVKLKTDGTVVQKITAPPEAGFKQPNEWRLTAAVVAPDGDIHIANGYGDSRIFRFDKNGNYKSSYGQKGSAPGMFDCCHGLTVDMRYGQPLLLVCDRENRRLCHYDFDGKYVATIAQHLRRPCQTSIHGDHVLVSELEGRAVILDGDNAPVSFLGDNADKQQWAQYELDPSQIGKTNFSAAHGCFWASDREIYISDWNKTGRVSQLVHP